MSTVMPCRTAALAVVALLCASFAAAPPPTPGPPISAYGIGGTAPTIDGIVSPGEWLWTPQIQITGTGWPATYVVPTYATFVNNDTDLFVLVDAQGDQTVSNCDECLLVFDDDTSGDAWSGFYAAEIYAQNAASATAAPLGGYAAMGFSGTPAHRVYEFRIPLASIGATPGQAIYFASPAEGKQCIGGSMPFDGSTGFDNVWPVGLVMSSRGSWSALSAALAEPVPSLGLGGLLALTVLIAAAGAVMALRRAG
jgi:hypothetical protein